MGNKILESRTVAIVVTYNRKSHLLSCIEALQKQKGASCDIIIVDNASLDGTEEAVNELLRVKASLREKIIYFNTGKNLGGGGGFAFGLRKGSELSYDYCWLMDDDCKPMPDSLTQLFDAHNQLKGEYGFLSSVALWKDGSLCKMNLQKVGLSKKLAVTTESLPEVIFATFVSLFLPMQIIEEIGLPIKEFFIWSDDLEYTRRISMKYKSYVVTASTVTHNMDINSGTNIAYEEGERLERCRYSYRNEVYIYRREGIKGALYQIFRLFFHLVRVMILSKNKKFYRCKIILESTLRGLSFNPTIKYLPKKSSET